ncbi:hypothetical protein AQ905_29010 [Burkholderia pseudomallei]|nr:hypothetical protein AQ905_29010 [Burkholderia pseudomallei]
MARLKRRGSGEGGTPDRRGRVRTDVEWIAIERWRAMAIDARSPMRRAHAMHATPSSACGNMSVMSTNGAVRAPRCASETAGNSAKKNMPGIAPLANARDDARRHVPIGKSIAPRRRAWFACAATAAPST